MKQLPYDISRCIPKDCDKKNQCARFTSKRRELNQVVCDFSGNIDCNHFIDNKNEK